MPPRAGQYRGPWIGSNWRRNPADPASNAYNAAPMFRRMTVPAHAPARLLHSSAAPPAASTIGKSVPGPGPLNSSVVIATNAPPPVATPRTGGGERVSAASAALTTHIRANVNSAALLELRNH